MANKANSFVFDRSQQIEVIRDIVYEYGNFGWPLGTTTCTEIPPGEQACDDAFLLGCRKLSDFLMNDDRHLDDVLALDYLPPKAARTWRLPIWNGTWRAEMNKYLAHIAYKARGKANLAGTTRMDHLKWVPQLVKEFNNAWWDFREAIVDVEFAVEFDEQIATCKKKEGFASIVLLATVDTFGMVPSRHRLH